MTKEDLSFKDKIKIWKAVAKKEWKDFKKDLENKLWALVFFIFAGICFWGLMQVLYYFYDFSILQWFKGLPYVYSTFSYVFNEIKSGSYLGVFFSFSISSLFFLPVPLEAIYLNFVRTIDFPLVGFLAVAGITFGQIMNYLFGRFFGFIFMKFIKKKTRRQMTARLKKFGGYAITLVHIIPFPFQLMNFLSGAVKFPFFRWLFYVVLGSVIKHIAMYYLFMNFL